MRGVKFVMFWCVLISFALFLSDSNIAVAVHEETSETFREEVPFDRPVEEILKYLAPMKELTIFKAQEVSNCSECHDEEWEVDLERRELGEPHDEIPGKFVNHDSENRWCLDCHSPDNRDKLRLINGKFVSFNEYYRLCEQCHKRIYREWKMGVHGKRTGYWNGVKEYLHCSQCHNPHDPPFKPLKPEPPPVSPANLRTMSTESVSDSTTKH